MLVCTFIASAHPQRDKAHIYIFDGFLQLGVSKNSICLDKDVRKELDEVLINPNRITIKSNIGTGQSRRKTRMTCNWDLMCDLIASLQCVEYYLLLFLVLGNFGEVFKGVLDECRDVAIKAVKGVYCSNILLRYCTVPCGSRLLLPQAQLGKTNEQLVDYRV